MAGLKPEDIDICELHDCFSIAAIIAAECLGFFDYGTAGAAWEKGDTAIGGKVAINPSGGLKAKGHPVGATGVSQIYDLVKQLRGDAAGEGRQVKDARHGLAVNFGGFGNNVVTTICSRGSGK